VNGRRFDAVLFDLDDTLHDDTAAYRAAAQRVAEEVGAERGVDAAALRDAYSREAESFWAQLDATQLQTSLAGLRAQMWGRALADVGIRDPALALRAAVDYNRFRAEELELFPAALPLLHALRAAGRKTALITNGFAETHREKIVLLRLEDAFDAVLIADEVGMVKPDPNIFLHACTLVGASPAASLMVGDRYERDIRGAQHAGLATLWVNPRGETLPAGGPPPDATVATFEEAAALLTRSLAA
jgi:putative hydrolase of the HAD superfamily